MKRSEPLGTQSAMKSGQEQIHRFVRREAVEVFLPALVVGVEENQLLSSGKGDDRLALALEFRDRLSERLRRCAWLVKPCRREAKEMPAVVGDVLPPKFPARQQPIVAR